MLKNFWYAVERSTNITHQPKYIKALGQEFALYRTTNDRVVALSNLCVQSTSFGN